MVLGALPDGLRFSSEEGRALAFIPWSAVQQIRQSTRPKVLIPVEVIEIDVRTTEAHITLYPGKIRGDDIRRLRGPDLNKAVLKLRHMLERAQVGE